jgi:putative transcriptional regulator
MSQPIQIGKLLLSDPFLDDEFFSRSVIQLCNHNLEGSFGFMINKPLEMKIHEAITGFPKTDAHIYYGGPVDSHLLNFLHNYEDIDDSLEVASGIFWNGDYEEVKDRISNGTMDFNRIKFFLGYSGWGIGQLQDEIDEENTWVVTDSTPAFVFDDEAEDLWSSILKSMGGEYADMARYPLDPQLN